MLLYMDARISHLHSLFPYDYLENDLTVQHEYVPTCKDSFKIVDCVIRPEKYFVNYCVYTYYM